MKISAFFVTLIQTSSALSCFTCHSESTSLCATNGTVVECSDNAQSCQITMRKRAGEVEQVQMGCKATDACTNNKSNNFRGSFRDQQCKPWNTATAGSVCWQCCNGDENCALDLSNLNSGKGPTSIAAWTDSMMT